MGRKIISIVVDEEMLKIIKENAKNENRSVSNYIESVLKKALNYDTKGTRKGI